MVDVVVALLVAAVVRDDVVVVVCVVVAAAVAVVVVLGTVAVVGAAVVAVEYVAVVFALVAAVDDAAVDGSVVECADVLHRHVLQRLLTSPFFALSCASCCLYDLVLSSSMTLIVWFMKRSAGLDVELLLVPWPSTKAIRSSSSSKPSCPKAVPGMPSRWMTGAGGNLFANA